MVRKIDLHGYSIERAVDHFLDVYNRHVAGGRKDRLIVVHGQSTLGSGTSIGDAIRRLLTAEGIEFLCGEMAGGIAGRTIVLPELRQHRQSVDTPLGPDDEQGRRGLFQELMRLRRTGTRAAEARQTVARRHRLSIGTLKRILREGSAKNWPS